MNYTETAKLRASDTRPPLPAGVRLSLAKYVYLSREARRDIARLTTTCILWLVYALNALLFHRYFGYAALSINVLVLCGVTAWFVYPVQKRYRRVSDYAMNGDLTVGKVISVSPYRVAVYTNVGMHDELWPVIKIVDPHFDGTRMACPLLGERIPSISMYHGDLFETHWQDFSPIPVVHFTEDKQAIDDCLQCMTTYDSGKLWADLDQYYAKVRTPTELGLYTFGRVDS